MTFDAKSHILTLILEEPKTKARSEAIEIKLSPMLGEVGRLKEYFYDGNIEVIQIKNEAGLEFEVNIAQPERFLKIIP